MTTAAIIYFVVIGTFWLTALAAIWFTSHPTNDWDRIDRNFRIIYLNLAVAACNVAAIVVFRLAR